jgi:hypothetical protein
MSWLQFFQWHVLYKYNLTYRFSPLKLFAGFSSSSSIKRVIHLCNHDEQDFVIKRVEIEEFVRLTTSILENEFYLANYKMNIMSSFPESKFWSTNKIYANTEKILKDAFKDVRIDLVYIPYMSDPNDLYKFLQDKGCLD